MVDLTSDDYVIKHIQSSIGVKQAILKDHPLLYRVVEAAKICVDALKRGNKIILAGNGGSAADAQHIAAEIVGRYNYHRPGLPAMSLSTDTSMLTAISNDYGYERVFERQLEAQGKAGDVFIGISTSGNSKNILLAVEQAKKMGITVVGLAGSDGMLQNKSDVCINIPSDYTPHIQEAHITIGHILCGMIEESIFPDEKPK
ncbi:MAG: D-sedoheptulose 7-phosphate isomerase [Gammaproteobacteria bacterium]|nr:D-sedoheptulose 7-phosphate isomerase [Gammaproteobacteria bacterium]